MAPILQPLWTLIHHHGSLLAFLVPFAGFIVLLSTLILKRLRNAKSKAPLPPGPKGEFLLGNLRQVPDLRSDLYFAQVGKELKSDVLYFNMLGSPLVVLNSVQAAFDLLDKRSAYYSSRNYFNMFQALGYTHDVALMEDGAQFRKVRKVVASYLSSRASLLYREIQLVHCRTMAKRMAEKPETWREQLSQFTTRVIFSVAYGLDCDAKDAPYYQLGDDGNHVLSTMGGSGMNLVDILPLTFTNLLPRWCGSFIPSLKFVHDNAPKVEKQWRIPLEDLLRNMENGKVEPSFTSRLIEAKAQVTDPKELEKHLTFGELQGAGGVIFAAGQDTTYSTMTTFVMGMLLWPDVQKEAQRQVDAVTGGSRIPDFSDWESIPVIERLVYESLRFHPPAPNGVPHKTTREDIYRGMRIPKGSLVIANAWAMTHDPTVYKDPMIFNPNRYLPVSEGGNGEPYPVGHFGFGRRVCPGQYLALANIWIAIATMLAGFDISRAKDADGKEILPEVSFTTGITSHPHPFSAVFTTRNDLAASAA